jgi:RHS repeat-associated protein
LQSTVPQIASRVSAFDGDDRLGAEGYDRNGNVTTNADGHLCGYNSENQLVDFNGGSVSITYDGDGEMVKKTIGTATTLYLTDDRNPSGFSQVVEETAVSGGSTNVSLNYVWGTLLVSQVAPGVATNYFVADGHRSTRLVLNATGVPVNALSYDAFGNLVSSNAAPQTAYLYTGQRLDLQIGTYDLRARHYQPQSGRFFGQDPAEGSPSYPGTQHRYLYCTGDPVNSYDPTGLAGETDDTRLGRAVERIIRDEFFTEDPEHRGRTETAISTLLGEPSEWPLSKKVDLYQRKAPDSTYIMEVKPLSVRKFREGRNAIRDYLDLLRSSGQGWRPGTFWDYVYSSPVDGPIIKSDNGLPLPGDFWVLVLPPIKGVIMYVKFKPKTPRRFFDIVRSLGWQAAEAEAEIGTTLGTASTGAGEATVISLEASAAFAPVGSAAGVVGTAAAVDVGVGVGTATGTALMGGGLLP